MNEIYNLTLAKEVAREGAWEVMGAESRIEKKIGKSPLLNLIINEIGNEVQKLPTMTLREVENFEVKIQFVNKIFNQLEE